MNKNSQYCVTRSHVHKNDHVKPTCFCVLWWIFVGHFPKCMKDAFFIEV